MSKYICSINIKIDKLGCIYIIDDIKNSKFYKFEGDLENLQLGRVHKVEDMHLHEEGDKSYPTQTNIEGKKYLEPVTEIIDGKYICNNINLNLKYKDGKKVLLKGKILLNNEVINNSLIEIIKVEYNGKEAALGTTTTDEDGMYYISIPLNKDCYYKIVATYVTY